MRSDTITIPPSIDSIAFQLKAVTAREPLVVSLFKQGLPPQFVAHWYHLTTEEMDDAMHFLKEHETEIEQSYAAANARAAEQRRYWEEKNRQVLARDLSQLPPLSFTKVLETRWTRNQQFTMAYTKADATRYKRRCDWLSSDKRHGDWIPCGFTLMQAIIEDPRHERAGRAKVGCHRGSQRTSLPHSPGTRPRDRSRPR
jgi:hypothetical protein